MARGRGATRAPGTRPRPATAPSALERADAELRRRLVLGAGPQAVREALAGALTEAVAELESAAVTGPQLREWALSGVADGQLRRLRRYALISDGEATALPVYEMTGVSEQALETLLPHRIADEGLWRAVTATHLAPGHTVTSLGEFRALALSVAQVPQIVSSDPPKGPSRLLLDASVPVVAEFAADARRRLGAQASAGRQSRMSLWVERRRELGRPDINGMFACLTLDAHLHHGRIQSAGVACLLGAVAADEEDERTRERALAVARPLGLDLRHADARVRFGDGARLGPWRGEPPPRQAQVRDLGELLGAEPCAHPAGEVRLGPNAGGDALVVGCRACHRQRLALVAAHRLPDGHPLLERALADEPAYLRAERRYAALRDEPRPVPAGIAALRARDGVVSGLLGLAGAGRGRAQTLAGALSGGRRRGGGA